MLFEAIRSVLNHKIGKRRYTLFADFDSKHIVLIRYAIHELSRRYGVKRGDEELPFEVLRGR